MTDAELVACESKVTAYERLMARLVAAWDRSEHDTVERIVDIRMRAIVARR